MANVRAQQQMIADTEGAVLRLALDAHTRTAAQDHHPFVASLVEPLAGGCCVAQRDDALEPNPRRVEKDVDALGRQRARNVVEEIVRSAHPLARARAGGTSCGSGTDRCRSASAITRFTSAPSSSTTLARKSQSMNKIKPPMEPYMTS